MMISSADMMPAAVRMQRWSIPVKYAAAALVAAVVIQAASIDIQVAVLITVYLLRDGVLLMPFLLSSLRCLQMICSYMVRTMYTVSRWSLSACLFRLTLRTWPADGLFYTCCNKACFDLNRSYVHLVCVVLLLKREFSIHFDICLSFQSVLFGCEQFGCSQ